MFLKWLQGVAVSGVLALLFLLTPQLAYAENSSLMVQRLPTVEAVPGSPQHTHASPFSASDSQLPIFHPPALDGRSEHIHLHYKPTGEGLRDPENAGLVLPEREKADTLLTEALISLAQTDYAKAVSTLAQAMKVDPTYDKLYRYRAEAYQQMGDLKAAIVDYSKAIEYAPNYVALYKKRAELLLKTGQVNAAIADFQQAAIIYPEDPIPYYQLGAIYLSNNNLPAAFEHLNAAIKWGTGFFADAYASRGQAFAQVGLKKKALSDYETAARLFLRDQDETQYQIVQQQINKLKKVGTA